MSMAPLVEVVIRVLFVEVRSEGALIGDLDGIVSNCAKRSGLMIPGSRLFLAFSGLVGYLVERGLRARSMVCCWIWGSPHRN